MRHRTCLVERENMPSDREPQTYKKYALDLIFMVEVKFITRVCGTCKNLVGPTCYVPFS